MVCGKFSSLLFVTLLAVISITGNGFHVEYPPRVGCYATPDDGVFLVRGDGHSLGDRADCVYHHANAPWHGLLWNRTCNREYEAYSGNYREFYSEYLQTELAPGRHFLAGTGLTLSAQRTNGHCGNGHPCDLFLIHPLHRDEDGYTELLPQRRGLVLSYYSAMYHAGTAVLRATPFGLMSGGVYGYLEGVLGVRGGATEVKRWISERLTYLYNLFRGLYPLDPALYAEGYLSYGARLMVQEYGSVEYIVAPCGLHISLHCGCGSGMICDGDWPGNLDQCVARAAH